jgi:hypothetical protein
VAFDIGRLALLACEAAQRELTVGELVSDLVPEAKPQAGDPIDVMLAFAAAQKWTLGTDIQLRDLL